MILWLVMHLHRLPRRLRQLPLTRWMNYLLNGTGLIRHNRKSNHSLLSLRTMDWLHLTKCNRRLTGSNANKRGRVSCRSPKTNCDFYRLKLPVPMCRTSNRLTSSVARQTSYRTKSDRQSGSSTNNAANKIFNAWYLTNKQNSLPMLTSDLQKHSCWQKRSVTRN